MGTDVYASEDEYDPDPEENRSDNDSHASADEQENNEKTEVFYELQPVTVTEEEHEEAHEESEVVDEDQRAEAQARHNLRPNRAPDYSKRLGHIMDEPSSTKSYDAQLLQNEEKVTDTHEPVQTSLREAVQEMQRVGTQDSKDGVLRSITGFIMMQMSAKAGIRKHGQVAIDALFQEFAHLHDLGVFLAQDAK
jgi:hypothetical protein